MGDSITKFEEMKNEIPTLQQVKEYFKNAKEVRCLEDCQRYLIQDTLIHETEKSFQTITGVILWDGKYAEIISYKDTEVVVDQFQKIGESMASLLKYKNEKYGNAVLEPINIFSGKCKAGTRLDDKLSRIKNNNKLLKNDVSDLIGYLMLTCIENGWDNFDEFKD